MVDALAINLVGAAQASSAAAAAAEAGTRVGYLNLIWVDAFDRGQSELHVYLTVDRDIVVRLGPAEGLQFDFEALRGMTGRVVVASGSPSTRVQPNGQKSAEFEVKSLRPKDGSGEDAVRPLDVR